MSDELGNLDKIIEDQLAEEQKLAEKETKEAVKSVKEEPKVEIKEEEIEEQEEEVIENKEVVKEVKAEQKPTKSFKEILAEQAEEEQKEAERREIAELAEDPIIKAARNIRKKNPNMSLKDVINYVAEFDVDKIDDKTLFTNSLSGQKLSPDQLEEEYKEFLDQKPYVKEAYLTSQREKLRAVQMERQKELGITSNGKPDVNELYSKSMVRLESTLEKSVGSEIDGIFITPEKAGQLYKESQKYFSSSLTKEGDIDVNEAFETAFAKLYRTEWRKEVQEKAKSEGKVEAFNELHNPNSNTMVQGKKAGKSVVYDKEVDKYLEELESNQGQTYLTNSN